MDFAFASIQGPAHKKSIPEVPKQDNCNCFVIDNSYHIGIVSDGAGSSKFSHFASEICVESLSNIIKRDIGLLSKLEMEENLQFQWSNLSKLWFTEVREGLLKYCKEQNGDVADYNCTLILVIKTQTNFFACNVGDGRAGGSINGKGFPIIVPFMTFTVGATYFIIKDDWSMFFRSYVINSDSCDYFFVSTDGPQSYIIDQQSSFTGQKVYDDILPGEMYYDSNLPFNPFFEGLISSLKQVNSTSERNSRITDLLELGKYQKDGKEQILSTLLKPELDDDKSLIIFFN